MSFHIDESQPHLGGYMTGEIGDPATYFPQLWTWLAHNYGVRRVIDIGCGEGHALRFFRDLGCEVLGVDGVPQDDFDIVTHDYTQGPWEPADADGTPFSSGGNVGFDLAWCCEFVEHVEEAFLPNFMTTFRCAEIVLMTHAFPGQAGWHHVNLREPDYWKGAMAGIGYEFKENLTVTARQFAAENPSPYNHFLRSGLAFERRADIRTP